MHVRMYVSTPIVTQVSKFVLWETFNTPLNVVDEPSKFENWHLNMHYSSTNLPMYCIPYTYKFARDVTFTVFAGNL